MEIVIKNLYKQIGENISILKFIVKYYFELYQTYLREFLVESYVFFLGDHEVTNS